MHKNKKIVVVLPAYNAGRTLAKAVADIPREIIDTIILVDDYSTDNTVIQAKDLHLKVIQHHKNQGYGSNQKTCYAEALKANADIIIMLHPDYQYNPQLIPQMVAKITDENYDLILGSRFLNMDPRQGGMPTHKYYANRLLTSIANMLLRIKLSEHHTGYRAFKKEILKTLSFQQYNNGFLFDNQFLVDCILHKFKIGEIGCPAKYFPEASTINIPAACWYGLGVLYLAIKGFFIKNKLMTHPHSL